MDISWSYLIFYALLIDSITVNVIAWTGRRWYLEHFAPFSRYFPAAKGWALYYLVLVLVIGYLMGVLPF